jgi:hypothetical protein
VSNNSIVKGLKARASARERTQNTGARNINGLGPSFGQGGAISQYDNFNWGIAYGTALPRSWETFSSGAFGPLNPIQPMAIDAPQGGGDRPEPRRWEYPVGWNMPMGQPGSEGLKLVSFANLRSYADAYSVIRACIQVRKEEILGLDWDITPTDVAARAMRDDPAAHDDFQERRDKAIAFFKRPDTNYHDFTGWMSAILEDILVVDALALYIHPPRMNGKGVFNSNISALEVIDGTTIRPMVDIRGGIPRPPEVAYQQYLWGVPRVDLMDIILETDIEGMDEPVDQFDADQIMYLPYTRRSWTPYGFPGIERAIIPVMTGLRRQQYQLEFFTEGTIPGQFIIPGDDISTPQQIRQLQETLNAIAGDQAWKHKIIVLPRGSDTKPQKDIELAGLIDDVVANACCMAYDVMPSELGILMGRSAAAAGSSGGEASKESAEINQRKALKPLLKWLKSGIFDHVLQDLFGQDDMQWVWLGLEDATDEEAQANNFKILTSIGVMSIDEVRTQLGMSPWGLPLTSDPVYMSATGVSSLGLIAPIVADANMDEAINQSALQTGNGASTVPLPGQLPAGQNQAPTVIGTSPLATPTPGAVAPGDKTGTSATASPGPGGRPTPSNNTPAVVPPTNGGGTPLHGNKKSPKAKAKAATAKAAQIEFDTLRRFLKKGKSIDKFVPEFIDDRAFNTMKNLIEVGRDSAEVIAIGRQVMKSADRVARRQDVVNSIGDSVTGGLSQLASQINDPSVGMIGFIDQGTRILQQGYHAALNAGAGDAAAMQSNVSAATPADFKTLAGYRASTQRGFLTGFAQDIKGGAVSPASFNQRLNLYVRSLSPTYEQGFGLATVSGRALGNSTNPADNVGYNDGGDEYDDLTPTYQQPDDDSSSNGMSAMLALAAMVGTNSLADAVGANQTDDNGAQLPPPLSDYLDAPSSYIVWRTHNEDPCDLCEPRDGVQYMLDTLPCWPGDGGFGEFCEGAANCQCTLDYIDSNDPSQNSTADNPFRDITVPWYAQRAAEESTYDAAAIDARAADIANVSAVSPAAAARMQARDALYGVPYTRTGPGGRYAKILKSDNNPLEPVVWNYLSQRYKLSAIDWVKDAQWTFNPSVSVADVTKMRKGIPADDPKVEAIKEQIENGRAIEPIILVQTDSGLVVADGNHRITALDQLGKSTVAAYIATGVGNTGPWETEMQDNSMKKFKQPMRVLYKGINSDLLSTLQIGDVLVDDKETIFSSVRPLLGSVATLSADTEKIAAGQRLIVREVSGNEVALELV